MFEDRVKKMVDYLHRSWVEIDINQLVTNLDVYRSFLSEAEDVMAVVKANAYGHGDIEVVNALIGNGVHSFAVSNIDEARRIRGVCKDCLILVLGYTPLNRVQELVDYNISQAIISREYANRIVECHKPVKCQIAIDTGMNRIGLRADDLDLCESEIRRWSESLQIEGVFTHLCVADSVSETDYTKKQIRLFEELCTRLSDLKITFMHCLNSAGGLWFSSQFSNLVRLGIVLYGLKPDYNNRLPDGIKPILTWKSVVSMVKTVSPGYTIGYGRSYSVNKEMRIATIPTGYADGYPRLLSNKGFVLINGCSAAIVGRICMDQMMVDVTGIPDVKMGTEVVLIGNSRNCCITADEIANSYGTIGYELVCGINSRVERVYI